MKYIKIILKGIFLVFIIVYAMPLIFLGCPHYIPNHLRVKTLAARIVDIQPPEDSERIKEYTYVGWVSGSGSGCKMIAGVLYGTGSTAGVKGYYLNKEVMGVDPPHKVYVQTIILKDSTLRNRKVNGPGFENEGLNNKIRSMKKYCSHYEACYFAYAYDISDLTMDIRCY